MEVKIMYPELIPYALIAAGVLLFAWRRRRKFKKGVMVANTKYLNKVKFYKALKAKYLIYYLIILLLTIGLVGIGASITARLYKEDKHEEKKEYYNRDIILCLDFSGSMGGIINQIIDQYIKIVEQLNGDRFGIVVFGGAPATVLPLTDDTNYAVSILKKLKSSNTRSSLWEWTGMNAYNCCSSSDGDGLAASILNFDKDDGRTKIVVLAADHGVIDYIVSLNEAAQIAKDYKVKVFYVDGANATFLFGGNTGGFASEEKKNAANITGGKYYDAHNLSISQIVKDIDSQNKTLLVETNIETTKIDLPEMLFPYLFYLTLALFVLDWRIRI